MRIYIFVLGIILLIVEAFVRFFGTKRKDGPAKDEPMLRDRWKLLIYALCAFIVYGLSLAHFDFWSDDFGYFQNFLKHSESFSNLSNVLISYLTGGVPRLQVGWHITHQFLFLVFKTFVTGYFFIQVLVLILNSFLADKVLKPIIGERASFWVGIFLIVSPFYKESFYWVSANYGFFQVLFFLLAYLALKRAVDLNSGRKIIFLLASSLSVVASTLFQEQALFAIPTLAIIFILFNWNAYTRKKTLIYSSLIILFVSMFIILSLFAVQFLLIKSSSPTNLIDTFKHYYATPVDSAIRNVQRVVRETFFGIKPRFEDSLFFIRNKGSINPTLRMKFIVTILSAVILLITLLYFLTMRLRSSDKTGLDRWKVLALSLWFCAAVVVVIPIDVFSGRYIYFVLPPALGIIIYLVVTILPKTHVLILGLLVLLSIFDLSAFYYGSFFPLTAVGSKGQEKIVSYLKKNPQVEAVILQDFPATLGNAVTGVWLNRHATRWSLTWKALPEKIKPEVGNSYYPALGENGESGFRLIYGDYPLERFKRVYPPKALVLARFKGSIFDEDPLISYSQRKPIDLLITEETVTLTNEDPIRDFDYSQKELDLKDCLVDVVAQVQSPQKVASVWLMSEGTKTIESIAHSSGLEEDETVFSRTIVRRNGPYRIRLTYQDVPYSENTPDPLITFSDVRIKACGVSLKADRFVRTNNPDPKNAMIRWTSPQVNYSVTLPYPNAPIWEKEYSIGINDAANTGDYYCFPDDLISVKNKDLTLAKNAYLGMLGWKRNITDENGKLTVTFSRQPGDPLTKRGELDIMPLAEFNAYERDDPPIALEVKHEFNLNKNYFPVTVTFTSTSSEPLSIRYMYSDSPVMDFKVGSNEGMESILLSNGHPNQFFYSTRNSSYLDIPIVYRTQIPTNNNLTIFEYSCDQAYKGSLLTIGDDLIFRGIQNFIDIEKFENNVLNKISNVSDRKFLTEIYSKNVEIGKYVLSKDGGEITTAMRNKISKLFDSVRFSLPENSLQLEKKFDQKDKSHGQHGMWFDLTLPPYSSRSITYYKVMLYNWIGQKDLMEQAKVTIETIKKEACSQ